MSPPDWFSFVKEGGAYCAPLLLVALLWLNADRNRLLSALKEKDAQVEELAERVLTVVAELKTFLFNRGGAG